MNTLIQLVYTHKYGEDITLYSSWDDAYEGAGNIITEYLGEVSKDETREMLDDLLDKKNYKEALKIWGEYQSEDGREAISLTGTRNPSTLSDLLTDRQKHILMMCLSYTISNFEDVIDSHYVSADEYSEFKDSNKLNICGELVDRISEDEVIQLSHDFGIPVRD